MKLLKDQHPKNVSLAKEDTCHQNSIIYDKLQNITFSKKIQDWNPKECLRTSSKMLPEVFFGQI